MKLPLLLSLIFFMFSLIAAPFLTGFITRIKAFFAGRKGQPLLQPYHDIRRLLRKSAVYSRSTSPLFYLAPLINLSALLLALAILPLPG